VSSEVHGSGSVLVIEDDESISALVEELLADEGYEVRCAHDAGGALDLIGQRPPAVILFDLGLPDMGGEQFVTAYRSLPNADAALIAVSGAHDLADVAAHIGADDFIAKPFDINDLLGTVKQAVPAKSA
jgi:DNA-binding response OmpR family regulator